MDDLLGEDWQAPAKPGNNISSTNASAFASNYSSFQSSPQPLTSGLASPQNISRPSSTVNANGSQQQKPAEDAFGSLLGNKSQKAGSNVSMQERQKQLIEEKRRQQSQQAQLWDTLGSGRVTPEVRQPSPAVPQEDEDDILAAFNKSAPVDKASHFPPPASTGASGRSTPAFSQVSQAPVMEAMGNGKFEEDDDDPFGLGAAPQKANGHMATPAPAAMGDDDDILGDLGRPVTERPPQRAPSRPEPATEDEGNSMARTGRDTPEDRALAELVDMGFPADTAKIALAENGGDVQGAVGWLLQQAHEQSKREAKAQAEGQVRQRSPVHGSRSPPRRQRSANGSMPAWMKQEGRSGSATRPQRQDSRSPANGEKDPAQMAQEFSSKLFKGANSLWKASQKQMAKTMSEFQQERDPSQPRWMQQEAEPSGGRAGSGQRRPEEPRARQKAPVRDADVTDEAAMLDAPREYRLAKPSRPAAPEPELRGRSPIEDLPHRPPPQPRFMQQAQRQPTPPVQDRRPATKLSRQEVEDQTAQAYVSPARRKRPTPKPEPVPEAEVDLFGTEAPKPAAAAAPRTSRVASARPSPAPTPNSVRPKASPRSIPSVSPSVLATSAQHRKAGGEAFKRGDYAAAHDSYTAALNPLPATHPITVIVLSNRSLTALKTGDARTAVSDADRALEIIGPAQGSGETIELGGGEGSKDMRESFGKVLMRKAEALEHMEKWTDAAGVWRQAIEAGVGGAVSLQGRTRCEKAAALKPATAAPVRSSAPAPRKAPPAKSLGNSMQRPALSSAVSAEAVKKLRAANAAAEKADDEKFALTDQVDARLTAWRGGKTDNLRALLQSMDSVLWEGAGWKKVGMSDLVMPNKVKIVYMKAIGKVHPDKIPQDATTEQRMISAAVFSTLNEAWDKFKTDNNL